MATTITCPHCHKHFPIDEAIKHELEEKIFQETQAKHQEEINRLKKEKEELAESKEKELEEAKKQIKESVGKEAFDKARREFEDKIQADKEEAEAQEKQNKELREQIKELLKQFRGLKDEKDKLGIEYEKKLLEDQDKIKQTAKREAQEELGLRIAEKDKKLQDAQEQILELQRKMQQGSQQLQGEVQELELEKLLAAEFPSDEVIEVKKGKLGADVIEKVMTTYGTSCGIIVWESKRTQKWTPIWIAKLKTDKRDLKGDIGVIVTADLPKSIESFGFLDGVWVCNLKTVLSLAFALRQQLIRIRQVEKASEGKVTKAEVVYNYLISNEFVQRIEVWVEYFKNRRDEIDKEKAYYTKKWNKEEKEIALVLQNTAGIYGDLQGLIGNALPKVPYLELPEEIETAKKS
ncbi:MAG: hypothetical protein A2785_01180 [Candidatus Chisholmbacteria bacterium RIFCSPHIGHO2_01_FULL_49_18]|uniref:DUF2130 domain-containing protein n=2 Tax=Candidatus Chisholmiibacteriota TaxID=1817900 RepID=A0A1G1VPV6_9BACT|nr:MAG: hypothetical protein A2785_01180 [Candidatus Chisholmbacteria bacterium RIFCSPHIGHO2_01_FULL_49_18]OGY19340.1 MAG: hypothetical protein A3A65_02050 [Candidatus Chisholmbacteria bacterium RIFCSPLOWO2_01_FULL_49_14]